LNRITRYLLCFASTSGLLAGPCWSVEAPLAPAPRPADEGSIFTRKDARAISLEIPAPRGQIVDREGEPLAQNRVAYQLALQYRQFESVDRDYVIRWARTRMEHATALTGGITTKSDDELFDHYRHRRWLPLAISPLLDEREARKIEPKLEQGLILHPVYKRIYPENDLAAHIIGYTGITGKLPTGPINFGEPLWETSEGRAGLEKLYDRQLTGEPGMKRLLFDEGGNKLLEEEVKRPQPGGTVVTTLNLKWQRLAEKVLKNGCKRGAFVVVDVITGEVLVMASRPTFDINGFIPNISEDQYKALQADPTQPLFGRAFQSAYPPASSFKPVIALTALATGKVTEETLIDCPAAIRIGDHTFNNWNKNPEGSLDVKRALARSCNPWFYQVGIKVGPAAFLSMARRLGYGEKSGLPLIGETPGLVPSNEWMLQHEHRRIMDGDTANLAIGQGVLLASPLQVAQAMAGIANGGALPKLHLIRQVLDARGRVVEAPMPERRNWLGVDENSIRIIHEGMRDVVNSGYGTGRSAALDFTLLCGKTGTAQWGPLQKKQRLAWFAGYLPFDNPRYSFAVLYEGKPGETVSGGRMSAPMVHAFFDPLKDELKEIIAPPPKAVLVDVEGAAPQKNANGGIIEDKGKPGEGILRAIPVEPATPAENGSTPPPDKIPKAIPVDLDEIVE
jgi:penicillin-binding protein 2